MKITLKASSAVIQDQKPSPSEQIEDKKEKMKTKVF